MAKKKDSESEWKEACEACEEKRKQYISSCFRVQKVGLWRIDYFRGKIEEIPYETPKVKARDKAQKLEDELCKIIEKAEDLSALGDIVHRGLKDMEERVQAYKLNETREQKKKGEYDE
jgi:hypothetical protein